MARLHVFRILDMSCEDDVMQYLYRKWPACVDIPSYTGLTYGVLSDPQRRAYGVLVAEGAPLFAELPGLSASDPAFALRARVERENVLLRFELVGLPTFLLSVLQELRRSADALCHVMLVRSEFRVCVRILFQQLQRLARLGTHLLTQGELSRASALVAAAVMACEEHADRLHLRDAVLFFRKWCDVAGVVPLDLAAGSLERVRRARFEVREMLRSFWFVSLSHSELDLFVEVDACVSREHRRAMVLMDTCEAVRIMRLRRFVMNFNTFVSAHDERTLRAYSSLIDVVLYAYAHCWWMRTGKLSRDSHGLFACCDLIRKFFPDDKPSFVALVTGESGVASAASALSIDASASRVDECMRVLEGL